MTNFYGKGSDIRARKEKKAKQNKTKQSRKFHYNFYDTVTALRAKLFVAKLMINQSLQGVGAGVEIENFYRHSSFNAVFGAWKKPC